MFQREYNLHAILVAIKNQNVSTALPLEFTKLRYLKFLELSRNCLYGTIPSEWATMHLTNLSLLANKFSGAFPMVLTRMTTLIDLSIEGNRFSGPIPKEIAKLKNFKKLHVISSLVTYICLKNRQEKFTYILPKENLICITMPASVLSSNDFTGELPFVFAKLTNLIILRIKSYSELNYIKRHIQGCSFEGPFPSGISALTRLNDLILMNCIINGTIPEYVWKMKYLDILSERLYLKA
ncbi:hypothetical protein QVD17_09627 [Tagetes erecta]|uniref:Uncharacterized protein n=1 Tax=Tagetes erecta TaxID=13708 RepID=A0AAD8L1T2_TARER|nr:hypothetical protein QVD17_09627 [Tagetes erecta]